MGQGGARGEREAELSAHQPVPLSFTALHPLFAASVQGIGLRRPLDAATVAAIDAAMDRHAVLVFRGQPMSQDEQVALAKQFGPLDAGLRKATGATCAAPQRWNAAQPRVALMCSPRGSPR